MKPRYGGPRTSIPFERWWAIANDRRQKLIYRDCYKKDLSFSQKRELAMLQKVASLVLEYTPFCCACRVEKHPCKCRCHFVGHEHKRDAKGRCSLCTKRFEEQKEFYRREKRADKLLALVARNGGL